MMRNTRILITAWILCAGVHAAHAQTQEPRPLAPSLEDRVPELRTRLATLTPAQPRAYFELGEEIAAEATEFSHKRLARELFVLALVLDHRAAPAPSTGLLTDQPSVASSACLALAAMAEGEDQRRWLSALAGTLGSDSSVDVVGVRTTAASRDPAAFELATLLGWVRAGEGRRAARILQKPGVAALLEKCDKLLIPTVGGGADRVRRIIDTYPLCQQCRNRRSIKGPDGVSLCPSCSGRPGAPMTQREIIDQLKVESMLLSGVQRTWAGQAAADAGAPLRDLDPAEVALAFSIDPKKVLWRDGRWVIDPAAEPAKPEAAESPRAPDAPPAESAPATPPRG